MQLEVEDLSRIGREYTHMGHLQDFIFPAYDVRFIAIHDDVDSAKSDNDFKDNVLGKLPDSRYLKLSSEYGREQQELVRLAGTLEILSCPSSISDYITRRNLSCELSWNPLSV